jgi:hypothetical protein
LKAQSFEEKFKQLIDLLRPKMGPYEFLFYLFLFRHSVLEGTNTIRMGKRTIAEKLGKGSKGKSTNYQHVTEVLKKLSEFGLLKIGDTDRSGTEYTIIVPDFSDHGSAETRGKADYFRDPELRKTIFERDSWKCAYCGETVGPKNSTLDHFVPQSKGGEDSKENLRTACLLCNSIKTGRSFEDAAVDLVKSIAKRNKA